MARMSRIGVMLVLAGLLSGIAACTPAVGQTAPTAAKKKPAGYVLPWLRKPKANARPPLPARKPEKPEGQAPAETAAAKPPAAFNPELVHAGIKPSPEPAAPAEAPAKSANAGTTATVPAEPAREAVAAPAPPAPARKPTGAAWAENKPKAVTASASANEPPGPDRKPPPAPAAKETADRVAATKDTARILPAQPEAGAKAKNKPAAKRTAHAGAAAGLPFPDRKPAKPKLPAAKESGSSQSASADKSKDKDKDVQKTAGAMSRKDKCLALRECRSGYTRCFQKLEKEVKPELWSAEREKCVAAYKICIDKYFTDKFDMFFTRYFVPNESCE